MRPARVTVVGAGVVGLTSAHVLALRGVEVDVVAAHDGLSQSSGAAGAVWFPYGAELASQRGRVDAWARETHAWLCDLAEEGPAAGVVGPFPTWVSAESGERPAWAGALPEGADLEWVRRDELPAEVRASGAAPPLGAWRFPAPVVHPARHLAWLEASLARPVERRRVRSFDELDADAIVNCTGCGAAKLAGDAEVVPRLGQTVVATEGELPRDFVVMDDRDEAAMLYAIPRGPGPTGAPGAIEVVLGGHDVEDAAADADAPPVASPEVTRAILARHAAAGIVARGALVEKVGRRPGRRSGPRVERDRADPRVVHAYGHGGAGFTLARGTARTVAELVLW